VHELTRELKEQALSEGFDLVGVATAGVADTAVHLDRWLDAGMHGDMDYMVRTRSTRTDPRQLLPGCSSVVVVAMSYRTNRPDSQHPFLDDEPRVWISRYAWGRDYHRVMKKRLLGLGRWLAARCAGARWRTCVDTAPILEREWAARAGLGWIGKNSQLLNRQLGSELFLGVLLTDVQLVPDTNVSDHCGRCTACLDACPTDAFEAPRVVDARRCIAYLTIEHRSAIPARVHRAMDAMVAGCDICQEVCPWTSRSPTDLHPEFQPVTHRFRPRLAVLEGFDEQAFRAWRAGSPLTRVPFPHFRRSLEVARANLCGASDRNSEPKPASARRHRRHPGR
jgi:epoxyqueuosine reductase